MGQAETPNLGGATRGPRPAPLRMRAQAHCPRPAKGAVGRRLGRGTATAWMPRPHPSWAVAEVSDGNGRYAPSP